MRGESKKYSEELSSEKESAGEKEERRRPVYRPLGINPRLKLDEPEAASLSIDSLRCFVFSFRVKYDTSSLLNVVTPKMTPTRRTVVTVSSVTTLGGVFRCLLSDCSDRFARTMMTTQTTRALILVSRISLYPLHQWRIEDTQSIVSSARESRG